jgi:hypothetical protein
MTTTKKYRIDVEYSAGQGMPLYVTDRADPHSQMSAVRASEPYVGLSADDATVMALACRAVSPYDEDFGGDCCCEDR